MPYNPGSAYPRKTVYVPPVAGDTSFQRAANAPDFTSGPLKGGAAYQAVGGAAFRGSNEAASRASVAANGNTFGTIQGQHNSGFLATQARARAERKGRQAGVAKKKTNVPGAAVNPDGTQDAFGSVANMPRPLPQQGNAVAIQKQQTAGAVADQMVEQVLTGDMPGDTGRANVRKSRKNQPGPGQQSFKF